MSIIQPLIPGARVLDLFAGSGALGVEVLWRGAAHSDLVEISTRSLAAVRANVEKLGAGNAAHIVRGDALKYVDRLEPDAYDIAFADPPYGLTLAARIAERWLTVPFAHVLGVEHGAKEEMPGGGDMRKYGDTAITFYHANRER